MKKLFMKIAALPAVVGVGAFFSGFFQKELDRKTAAALRDQFAGKISLQEKQALIDGAAFLLFAVKTATALIAACLIVFIVLELIRKYKIWKKIQKYSEDL